MWLPVQRSAARAELYAVWQALRHACPLVRIHVGCASVLAGIAAGR